MTSHSPNRKEPTPAEVRAALERILRSRSFTQAERASTFLRFVVAETLAGRGKQLKGYTIAVSVFGRPADFDAQADPLVRVEAVRLRQRLLEYYSVEGAADPIRLQLPRGHYAVEAAYTDPGAPAAAESDAAQSRPRWLGTRATVPWRVAAFAAAFAVIGGVALLRPEPQAPAPVAATPPETSHKTRIVVVPLENLSSDQRLSRLAASLTEEIMLRLDDLDLFVIATQAQWYGTDSPLQSVVGSEHSYVLTGSVRPQAGGARISVRIIAGESGAQLWTAAFDDTGGGEMQRVSQANVAREVAVAAAPFGPVFDAELALARRAAHTLELPDCQTRYRAFRRATDPALFPAAAACFQSLAERRPEVARAWAGVAMIAIDEHLFYSGAGDAAPPLARAWEAIDKALALESNNVLANIALARAQYYSGDQSFLATSEKLLELDPNNPEALAVVGILLTAYGDDVHGLELVDRAQSVAARPLPTFNVAYAFANLRAGRPCEALAAAHKMESPNWFITYVLATAAGALCGDEAATTAARTRLLALSPNFEAEATALVSYWRFDPVLEEALLTGLRAAGLDLREQR